MKIFAKVFLLLALVSAVPIGAIFLLVLRQAGALEEQLLRDSQAVGARIQGVSRGAIEEQARKRLATGVRDKSEGLSSYFENIGRSVLLQARLARRALDVEAPAEAPPIYEGNEAARLLQQEGTAFASRLHKREAYVTYFRVREVSEERIAPTLAKLRPLGDYFSHANVTLEYMSSYIGHRDGFILGYPGSKFPYPETYDPRKRPWYLSAMGHAGLVWTDLYLDRNKNDLVITCSKAVDEEAVAAVDVKVTRLIDDLAAFDDAIDKVAIIEESGLVRVGSVTQNGKPAIDSSLAAKPLPVAEYSGGAFAELFRRWSAPGGAPSGVFTSGDLDAANGAIYAYGTIKLSGGAANAPGVRWVYAVKLPVDAILGPVRAVRKHQEESMRELSASIQGGVKTLAVQMALLSVLLLVAIGSVAWQFAHATTGPLVKMSLVAEKIGRGELDQHVEVRSKDEIGQMAAAINEMIKGLKERDFVKNTFKMYVAGSVVDQLLKNPDRIKLGGEKRVLTIFFSDLANFTSLAEKMKAEDLVLLVNEYLEAMTNAIWEHEGTIDKYGGDSIMAFWGAPIGQENHALRGCKAAIANQERLEKLWPSWEARGLPRLQMRIGINTGPVIVGNMGSSVKRDYTVLGDPVNLGSRLEGANKFYGTHICISEATRTAAGPEIETRELDLLAVKGKKESIRIFELVGLAGAVPAERLALLRDFEKGLAAYRARDWDGAEAAFRRLPGDGPSETFLHRVEVFRREPPPPTWDGTWVMKEK